MPIENLSERRRLPRLGKIHLGIKKMNDKGVEYPLAVDYFVCPDEVKAVYGDQPKSLDIIIPTDDEEQFASQYYRCYFRTRGLVCKGDGINANRTIDPNTGDLPSKDTKETQMVDMLCDGKKCPDYRAKKCKEVMFLQFMLPKVVGLGIWQIDTSSINSIRNINDTVSLIRATFGKVSMIPLQLTLEPLGVTNPDDGRLKTVHVLNLRTMGTMMELLESSRQLRVMLPAADVVEMPDAEDEIPDLIIPSEQAPDGEAPVAEKTQAEKAQAEKTQAERDLLIIFPNPNTGTAAEASVTKPVPPPAPAPAPAPAVSKREQTRVAKKAKEAEVAAAAEDKAAVDTAAVIAKAEETKLAAEKKLKTDKPAVAPDVLAKLNEITRVAEQMGYEKGELTEIIKEKFPPKTKGTELNLVESKELLRMVDAGEGTKKKNEELDKMFGKEQPKEEIDDIPF